MGEGDFQKFHIATKPGEIAAHGHHIDHIEGSSFGSTQMRFDRNGVIIDGQLNFRGGDRFRIGANGMPDPRGTGHGGYNR